jgi:hypothetical protein
LRVGVDIGQAVRPMERVVRVRDMKVLRSGFRVFLDLPDLLPVFDPDGHAWQWAIRSVPEITADERWDLNVPFIEAEMERNPRGLLLSFPELKQLGDRVHQVIWGEFVAAETAGQIPRRSAGPAEVGAAAVAGLAAVDSTYWLLGGPADVVERAHEAFQEVDELSASDWISGDQ